MKSTEYPEPRKLPARPPESRSRVRQLPRELLELQDHLQQLSAYVEKYNRVRDNLSRQGTGVRAVSESEGKWRRKRDLPAREMGFSVREEIGEASPVQIIEMTPPEEVAVISGSKDEDEKELSPVISSPAGKGALDPASDDSQIGIYFIEHVEPANFVNVLQRELSTLGNIFPGVNDIVGQMAHEFDHFKKNLWDVHRLVPSLDIRGFRALQSPNNTERGKACQKCLEKVSPLLPDILKELQELIKFVKKKRNEVYTWPDDSDYLRKTSEPLSKPFEKQVKEQERRRARLETVGFLTVHTNTPEIIQEYEASIKGESRASRQPERISKCSVGVGETGQLNFLQPKTQGDLAHFQKTDTAEAKIPESKNGLGENSFPTEFSTSQELKILFSSPAFKIVLQYRLRGNIESLEEGAGSLGERSERPPASTDPQIDEEVQKSRALEAKESPVAAESAPSRACFEPHAEGHSHSKMVNELETGVRDLKNLMQQVHKHQIALGKVLLEKEVLDPAITALTDPRVLREEKEGVRRAQVTLNGANSNNPRREDLQCFIDKLRSRSDKKNRLIMSLLKGLRTNFPCEEWEDLIAGVRQDSDSGVQAPTRGRSGFFQKSSLTFDGPENVLKCQVWNARIQRPSGAEDILSEREIARGAFEPGRNSARVSLSEIPSQESESSCGAGGIRGREPLSRASTFTTNDLNEETEKLFRDLENEVNSLTFEHKKILCEIEGLKTRKPLADGKEDNKTVGSGSKTINLTIKIGDQESMSAYHSALSIVPSGATLKEKKPELSFLATVGQVPRAPATKCSLQEFTSALSLSREELTGGCDGAGKSTKSFTNLVLKLKLPVSCRDEDGDRGSGATSQRVTEEKHEHCRPVALGSGTKPSTPRRENIPGSYVGGDFVGNPSSNDGMACSRLRRGFAPSEFPQLHTQMSVHRQNQKMERLRSRLRFLEKDLRCLRMALDRMDILTEKLVDDARESSENFKCVCDVFRLITTRASI